jgi:ABC-2 type transport system ATP-binding protein
LRRETGVTLFLTTHYLEEAEQCDRVAIIDHGRIIALDTPDRLKARVGRDIIVLATADDARAASELRGAFLVSSPWSSMGTLRVEVERGDTFIPELVRQLSVPIRSVSLRRPSLDDVFLALTGRQIRS